MTSPTRPRAPASAACWAAAPACWPASVCSPFPASGTTTEPIPLVKEELEVGKRQTEERVHVRVQPVERPVEKTVTLKDERIVVERRPTGTNQPNERDLAPREFEVIERHETPVAT